MSGLLTPPLPGWPLGPLRGRGSRPCPGLSHQGQTPHPHGCSHTRFQTWGWGRLGLSPGCRRVSPPGTCPLPATPPERMGLLRPSPFLPMPHLGASEPRVAQTPHPPVCSQNAAQTPSLELACSPRGLGDLHMQSVASNWAPDTQALSVPFSRNFLYLLYERSTLILL